MICGKLPHSTNAKKTLRVKGIITGSHQSALLSKASLFFLFNETVSNNKTLLQGAKNMDVCLISFPVIEYGTVIA